MALPLAGLLPLVFNRYVGIAVLAAGAAWGFVQYRDGLIQRGYDTAMSEVREQQDEARRKHAKEREDLLARIKKLEADDEINKKLVGDFLARNDDLAGKLRAQQADFDKRLERASAAAVRDYAKAIDSNLEGVRGHLARFAAEAASCSGTAHTLKNSTP